VARPEPVPEIMADTEKSVVMPPTVAAAMEVVQMTKKVMHNNLLEY
jgi:hypothetical protein